MTTLEFPASFPGGAIVLDDEAGRMLVTAGPGVYREDARIYTLGADRASARSAALVVSAGLIDHEGSLWLGTRGAGLHRLEPAPFRVYGAAEGLADRNAYSVYEDRDGARWVGSFDGHATRIGDAGVTNDRRDGRSPSLVCERNASPAAFTSRMIRALVASRSASLVPPGA